MLNFALIGCGRISLRHSDLLGNNVIQNAPLAAVCDIDLKKAEILGEKYSVPVYSGMHKEDIDVAVVLTPSGFNAEHVIQIAKYNKHIIVEKPDGSDFGIRRSYDSGLRRKWLQVVLSKTK
ncbi:Gfo/Idh/MocA family protein [Leptospira kirschneri]|uniref:Gfo/Idh/MocA family protein n=1 Tax=Leptospira kirschneri TaxID=29507 RepID=UPI00398B7CA9